MVERESAQRRRGRPAIRHLPASQRRRKAFRLRRSHWEKLRKVWISHAHPDHFLGLDVIVDRFPDVDVLTTPNVSEDLKLDGPWMFDLLKEKLGPEAAERLIEPTPINAWNLPLGESTIEVVEFAPARQSATLAFILPTGRHSSQQT